MRGHVERAEGRYGKPVAQMPPLTRRGLAALEAAPTPVDEFVAAMIGLACEGLGREWEEVAPLAEHAAGAHLRGAGAHAAQSAAVARFTEAFGELLARWCGGGQEDVWEWARWAGAYLAPEPEDAAPVAHPASARGWLAQ